MYKLRFFDFEVLPNWWLCIFGDYDENNFTEEGKKDYVVIHSDMPNARDLLLEQMREENVCVVGYNIKRYDLIIANAVYQGCTPQQIKIINDMIIDPSSAYKSREGIRLIPFSKKKLSGCVYQDLMDDGVGSLKEKEMVMGLNVLESSVNFEKEDLTPADKEDLIYYCKQDVYAAMAYYKEIVAPYTAVKLAMGLAFNIPEEICHTSTNARLVSIALGAKRQTYSDAEKFEIELPKKIDAYCRENVPAKVLEQLMKSKDGFTINLFGNEVSYGNGGIHSILANNIYVESTDDYCLVNVDATSYYPSMLIQFDCLSRSVTKPELFKFIFDERIRIKHKKDKTPEDDAKQKAYKLVLNTTFGASGNKYIDLYDPHMCTRTCRLGQIFLTALAMKLTKVPTLKIIQTNTDGILVYVKRAMMPKVKELMEEWSNVSGINMEEEYVDKIWQRDVNNYLLVECDGSVKRKGLWLTTEWRRPGYVTVGSMNGFVSARAVQDYLLYGKDVVKSIVENTNIRDFTMSCMKGPSYSKAIQRLSDGTEIDLYKCNRVYASKDKSLGKVYKVKKYKDRLSYTQIAGVPENCRLINEDLDKVDFNEIKKDLDYMFYVEKAADLLNIPWVKIRNNEATATDEFDYFK